MNTTKRLVKRTLRASSGLAIALVVALAATSQLNTASAHAASNATVYIQETNAPYGSLYFQTGFTGADCYMRNVLGSDGHYHTERTVQIHAPAVQTGSVAADYRVWMQIFDANTGAASQWYQSFQSAMLPANSGPWLLGGSVSFTDSAGLFGMDPIKAQVYVGIYYASTNVLMGYRQLTVSQYSISYLQMRTNAPNC